LVGFYDQDEARASALAERNGGRVYKSLEEVLNDPNVEAIVNLTLHISHYPVSLAALKAGKHVYSEKPISIRTDEANELVETAAANGLKLACAPSAILGYVQQNVWQRIREGEIGDVVLLKATDKGGRKMGNSLMEMGTHLYDWLRLFGGDVEWTHAHLVQMDGRQSTVDDIKHTQEVHPRDRDAGIVLGERGHASFRFKNGIHADVQYLGQSQTNDNGYGIDIIGTEGRIAVRESVGTTMFIHRGQHKTPADAWEPVHLPAEDLDEGGNPRNQGSIRLLLQRLMLRDLIEAIEEDRDPFASGRDGRDCLEMIHATWESHRQKARVYMPLTPREHPLERWRREESGL